MCICTFLVCFFFFNDTATTEIYTLSLHDALPISGRRRRAGCPDRRRAAFHRRAARDRESTRLNSRHTDISRMSSSACKKKKKCAVEWRLDRNALSAEEGGQGWVG